ncbi:SPOR domain-containing protein [Zoogloea sp.]|uniref:SPOR domain-containing protein n=1 Tax=Zoogloea sp. TaxID=49181 RepID=UPI002629EEE6|nr:SPOR domain-containing protein [Zoogloea sp.]MDD3353422.1 SPOR domain-containing protein [Zoogloea sp.]
MGADSTPVAPALASAAVREPALAGVQTSSRAYALQFGHFSSFQAAEEVRARLAQAGMPARVEARVVVGPFADRIQAEQAQSRLKEKGLDAGALIILAR